MTEKTDMCIRPRVGTQRHRRTEGPEQHGWGKWELRPKGSHRLPPGQGPEPRPHVPEARGLGRLRLGRTQLHRHQGPAGGF